MGLNCFLSLSLSWWWWCICCFFFYIKIQLLLLLCCSSNHSRRMNESLEDPWWEFSLDLQELWQLTDLVWVVGGHAVPICKLFITALCFNWKRISHISVDQPALWLCLWILLWWSDKCMPLSCHVLAPPQKSTQNSLINPFCKITKMHNSSNIIAADGLSVMNFFWETGWGVSSLFLKLSPTKSASKIQMHLCGQDWHLEKNGIQ